MRAEGSTAALHDYATTHRSQLWWPDQDAFNVVLGADRVSLHPRWNCMNSVLAFPEAVEVFGAEATEEARRNPAIRHFEGPSVNKPWHLLSDPGSRELYRQHRRQTPWPRYVPAGITPRNVLRVASRAVRRRVRP
jgi:lipopolysaccharide biosynthesis glycosyltransferase